MLEELQRRNYAPTTISTYLHAVEAKTLASLNHPNIAAIYGLEESGGISALVMELVEGGDLSQRIALAPPHSMKRSRW